MMHLFLNCLAASAGSGLTYVRNIVPQLATRSDLRVTLLLAPQLRDGLGSPPNISFVEARIPGGASGRFLWEQCLLPRLIRDSGADVVISAGNFALRRSPAPQILLSGNSLYTSSDFFDDLRERRAHRILWDTRIRAFFARRSVRWADCTVAPSKAFANTLRAWTRRQVVSIYHGFDPEIFFGDQTPLPPAIQKKIDSAENSLRLVFVSHYNYYRNFETLLRSIPHIRKRLPDKDVKLFLTCKLSGEENLGAYRAGAAAALVRQLGISDHVIELGAVPYHCLHHLIRACDIYVTPAYTETFAHPLVEAMACGLPVVASDLPVHREICGDAAVYFPRFSAEGLAQSILDVAGSSELEQKLVECGLKRSRQFSWRDHVDKILSLARSLQGSNPQYSRAA